MPIDNGSFKSFGVTGANQGMSVPTHVTKDYAMRENSSSLDPITSEKFNFLFKNCFHNDLVLSLDR